MTDRNDPIERRLARLERANRVLVGIISTTFLLICSALRRDSQNLRLRKSCGREA